MGDDHDREIAYIVHCQNNLRGGVGPGSVSGFKSRVAVQKHISSKPLSCPCCCIAPRPTAATPPTSPTRLATFLRLIQRSSFLRLALARQDLRHWTSSIARQDYRGPHRFRLASVLDRREHIRGRFVLVGRIRWALTSPRRAPAADTSSAERGFELARAEPKDGASSRGCNSLAGGRRNGVRVGLGGRARRRRSRGCRHRKILGLSFTLRSSRLGSHRG